MQTTIIGGRHNTPQIINTDGHAHTHSWAEDPMAWASWQGDAFSVLSEHNLVGATVEEVFYLKNVRTGRVAGREQVLVIKDLHVSVDLNTHIEMYLDPVYTSGGVDVKPIMMHRGKSVLTTSDLTLKDGSTAALIMGIAQSQTREAHSMFVGAYTTLNVNFHGALYLPPGKSLLIRATGTTAGKVRAVLNAYWAAEPE